MNDRYAIGAKNFLKLADYDRKILIFLKILSCIISVSLTIKLILVSLNCCFWLKKRF